MEKAETPIVIHFHFLGFHNLINCWILSLLSFGILFFLLWRARTDPQWVPSGIQNFVELSIEFVWNFAESQVGKHAAFFFPLFFTLFFFIFFSNLMGVVPGLMSPTSRIDVNLGMVLIVILSVHLLDIKENGLKGYLAHYLPPKIAVDPKAPLFLRVTLRLVSLFLLVMMPFIHLIGELAKPLSLTFRLFGNMLAKEILLAVLILLAVDFWGGPWLAKAVSAFPFLLRAFIVVFGIFVAFIQAFVFMVLSMVYIGANVRPREDGAAGH